MAASGATPGHDEPAFTPAARRAVWPQYLLPKRALTQLAGQVAGAHGGALTTALIRAFVRRYGVDMTEAADPDPARYASFNEFFTRALAPGARPLADAPWLCPVDGAISRFGALQGDSLLQAKGHTYSATTLLGGDAALAARFHGGHFATLYLSPRDYHRIHMPAAGRLRRMVHVPGALFSVNPTTARGVPGLFARNERVVCVFDALPGGPGPFVLVLVGATIVGSMATVWHGVVNPPRPRGPRIWNYEHPQDRPAPGPPPAGDKHSGQATCACDRPQDQAAPGPPPVGDKHSGQATCACEAAAVDLARGQEMGRFLLGSTVVLLLPPGPLRFNPQWAPGGAIRMGQAMAAPG